MSGADVRKVDLRESVESRLGAANKTVTKKELRNVGPSMSYKLRDAAGQAREYHNYMLPVDTGDGTPVFLLGVREARPNPSATCACLPMTRAAWTALCACACAGRPGRSRAGRAPLCGAGHRAFAARTGRAAGPICLPRWRCSPVRCRTRQASIGGLQAISDFMEANVPEAERERAGEVLMRILNGTLFELAS
jgi:cytochrome c biogenesis protein